MNPKPQKSMVPLNTKQSKHMVPSDFQNTKIPQAGQGLSFPGPICNSRVLAVEIFFLKICS